MRQHTTFIRAVGSLTALVLTLCFHSLTALAEPEAFDYILPEADIRYYTDYEIADMPLQVVCYAKNEIYARHGRQFRSVELTNYFNEQPWYYGSIAPDQFSDSVFNSYEASNVMLLSNREQALQSGGYVLDQSGYSFAPVYDYIDARDGSTADAGTTATYDHSLVEGTDAVSAYLQVLQNNQEDILAYNWQAYPDMNTYPNPSPKTVAFFDLTGDGVDELLFLSAPANDYGYQPTTGILHIYSWDEQNGWAEEIFHSPDYIDFAVGGGCYYIIYQNLSTGGFSTLTSGGDETWTNTLTEYVIGEDGTYDATVILEDYSYPDYDSANYDTIHDYYRNQEVTSAESYQTQLQNSWVNHGTIFFWSDYGSVANALGINALPAMIATAYETASSYLASGGEGITPAILQGITVSTPENASDSSDAAIDIAYMNFLWNNQSLFNQQQRELWYGTYDIDGDGVQELFVRYPAGVRAAIQIFTYSDGQVVNLCPESAYGDQAFYAAEEIMQNGEDSSICIGSSGGAAYHYNTFYEKQGDALVQRYQLFRDYAEDTFYCDDVQITEAEYNAYLNGYYEVDIEFVSFY